MDMNFTANELNTPINELEADAFEYIVSQLENDHHLAQADITYFDENEVASIVNEYMDLLS